LCWLKGVEGVLCEILDFGMCCRRVDVEVHTVAVMIEI